MFKPIVAAGAVSLLALSSTAHAANVLGPIYVDNNQTADFSGQGTYGPVVGAQLAKFSDTTTSPPKHVTPGRVDVDQAAIHTAAVQQSNAYKALAQTAYTIDWAAKTLTGTAGVNVINLDTDAATLAPGLADGAGDFVSPGILRVINGLTFIPNGATQLIFNIRADSNNDFGSGAFKFDPGGLSAANVIFNFLGNDEVKTSGTGLIQGTILAPYAHVNISGNSTVTGRVDALSFEGSGGPGVAAPVIPGVPEPTTWGMMILGLGAVGATLRRKQQARVSFG